MMELELINILCCEKKKHLGCSVIPVYFTSTLISFITWKHIDDQQLSTNMIKFNQVFLFDLGLIWPTCFQNQATHQS